MAWIILEGDSIWFHLQEEFFLIIPLLCVYGDLRGSGSGYLISLSQTSTDTT